MKRQTKLHSILLIGAGPHYSTGGRGAFMELHLIFIALFFGVYFYEKQKRENRTSSKDYLKPTKNYLNRFNKNRGLRTSVQEGTSLKAMFQKFLYAIKFLLGI